MTMYFIWDLVKLSPQITFLKIIQQIEEALMLFDLSFVFMPKIWIILSQAMWLKSSSIWPLPSTIIAPLF